ncbi:MAG: hypothetical protein ACT4P1_11190 [Sporichthyaceae bacterium]
MEIDGLPDEEGASGFAPATSTLYAVAGGAMAEIIKVYLDLAARTDGFNRLAVSDMSDAVERRIILGGINSPLDAEVVSAAEVVQEWTRMQAIPFSVENAVTRGVYIVLRSRVTELLEHMRVQTDDFKKFDGGFVSGNAYLLPVFQRLLNITSKSKLKEAVGSVNDNSISKPAGKRIADLLNAIQPGRQVTVNDLRLSIEPTLEGIVRDLVGRVLLEDVVANALDVAGVVYKRESEYDSIAGVVYSFRADFVAPDEVNPLVFIEVRKSSSRHASLYAKDKMFSAINWKGHNKRLMAILVTEGPWTEQTLQVMAKVFDYVIPLRKVPQMAEIVAAYLQGDESQLRLLIDFAVRPNAPLGNDSDASRP